MKRIEEHADGQRASDGTDYLAKGHASLVPIYLVDSGSDIRLSDVEKPLTSLTGDCCLTKTMGIL